MNNHDPNYEKSLPFIFGTPVQLAECAVKVLRNHSHSVLSKSRKNQIVYYLMFVDRYLSHTLFARYK